MTFGLSKVVIGIAGIVAGVVIFVWPEFLRWLVGSFLIAWSILTIMGKNSMIK